MGFDTRSGKSFEQLLAFTAGMKAVKMLKNTFFLPSQVPSKCFWKLRPLSLQNGSVKKRRGRIYSRVIPGTPKDMGPPLW